MTPRVPILRSLRGRLLMAVLLSSLVAVALTCAGLFAWDLQDFRAGVVSGLQVQAQLIGNTTSAALQFDDPVVAEQNLGFLKARRTVRAAALYTRDGKLFARYTRPDVNVAEVPPKPEPEGATVTDDQAAVFRDVTLPGGEAVGSVFVKADLELGARMWTYLAIAAMVMVGALGVSLLLSAWFQARITRPLIEMGDLAHRVVETRDYRLRVRTTENDEVGRLGAAFNGMLSEIEARTAALEHSAAEINRLNKDLERRVIERTAQLEESNRMLEAANAAKSTFLSTMSHEIRTPMNGVLGMLELLSLSDLDRQQRTTLEVVRDSGRSLLRIIDDILDFSKIEAGKLEIRMEPTSVADVLEGVRSVFSGNASSKGLSMTSRLDTRISPALVTDPLRLRQILNNFVSNAIKFTSKGSVQLRAELVERRGEEDIVRFEVADTGIGIPEDAKARLFQPFSQAAGEITAVFGGTGLGLSIASRLAELMGGTVELKSELGHGTTASVLLPMKIASPTEIRGRPVAPARVFEPKPVPTLEQAAAEGRLVLVVDDHPINRLVLLRQIGVLGYASEAAENGKQALALWESRRYGAILTDCNMPEMNGYELARTIRMRESREGRPHTVIIACTANALRGEAANCFAAGMDDYVAKPVDLTQLHEKLGHWLPPSAAQDPESFTVTAIASNDAGPVDRSMLEQVSGGDSVLQDELLDQLHRTTEHDCVRLEEAIAARDMDAVVQFSHRISGASRAVGAHALAAAAGRVESAARSADVATMVQAQDAVHRERRRLAAYVEIRRSSGK